MLSCLSCVPLFAMLWTVALQAPLPWHFPGKNTGVGCHFLLQEIFPLQRLNLCFLGLLHWQVGYFFSFTTSTTWEAPKFATCPKVGTHLF